MAKNDKELQRLGQSMILAYEMHGLAKSERLSCKKALAELEKVSRGAPIAERRMAIQKQLKKAENDAEIWKRSYELANARLRQAENR